MKLTLSVGRERQGINGDIKVRSLEIGEVVEAPHSMVVGGKNYTTESHVRVFWTTERDPKGEILDQTDGWTKVRDLVAFHTANSSCNGTVRVTGPVPGYETLGYAIVKCDKCEFDKWEELWRVV